jgi:hypothetical protein
MTDLVTLCRLGRADLPAAMALVAEVGWNQTPADWMRFLSASPDGCFGARFNGAIVGTTTTISYGAEVSWIGMVIVDMRHRGRGIAGRLMTQALGTLDALRVPCVRLDATPAGRCVYERFGFVAEHDLERWELVRDALPPVRVEPSPFDDRVCRRDRDWFGADRAVLLRSFAADAPAFAITVGGVDDLEGYGLGRSGRRADHLGPWAARDESAAARILDEFLARSSRSLVYVDCVLDNPWARRLLAGRGFNRSRSLTRMRRGEPRAPLDVLAMGAIAGPEFG